MHYTALHEHTHSSVSSIARYHTSRTDSTVAGKHPHERLAREGEMVPVRVFHCVIRGSPKCSCKTREPSTIDGGWVHTCAGKQGPQVQCGSKQAGQKQGVRRGQGSRTAAGPLSSPQ